jgi:uncharacterized protein (TIGR02246 family)
MKERADLRSAEEEIREKTEQWADAVRAKDYDGILAHYADDVVVFDVPPPLQKKGKEAYRKNWENWLGGFKGRVDCEVAELTITACDTAAFVHCLTRISDNMDDGTKSGNWVRVTVGFEKRDGRWLATHEHVSIPAGMGEQGE